MEDTKRPGARGGGDPVEVEWQFDALDLRPVERWLDTLPTHAGGLRAVTSVPKAAQRLVDRYVDTDDWRIMGAGFVLRTRRRGRKDQATLKDLRPADTGGLRQRLEVTEALPAGGVAALTPDGPVGWRIAAVAGRRPLRPVLEVRTRRRPFSLVVDGTEVAELALDETLISAEEGDRPVQLRRVEVEVVPEWVETLTPVVDELRASCGLQPAALSKFEAGLLALGVRVPEPVELGPTHVSPDSTLGELAYAVIRRHLRVLIAKEPGTRLGEDAEELHDMRVATRRLRAAIDVFSGVLPARAELLRAELRWLAAVLGDVRDLDVQLERTEAMEGWSASWAPTGAASGTTPLDELVDLLGEERTAARVALLSALDSTRYERLVSGLVQMVQGGPNRRLSAARLPAALAVPDLVLDRHRAALRAAKRAKRSGVPADFHRLRIRCKRLRYSLEFTSDVYGSRTDRFVRRLARLQDQLGLMQDAEVATARLTALAVGSERELPLATVFAMGGLAERYRTEAAELLAVVPKRLVALKGREWDDLAGLMDERRCAAQASWPLPRVTGRLASPAGSSPGAPGDGGDGTEPAGFVPAPTPNGAAVPAATRRRPPVAVPGTGEPGDQPVAAPTGGPAGHDDVGPPTALNGVGAPD